MPGLLAILNQTLSGDVICHHTGNCASHMSTRIFCLLVVCMCYQNVHGLYFVLRQVSGECVAYAQGLLCLPRLLLLRLEDAAVFHHRSARRDTRNSQLFY
jgi:hypothetical protein